MEISDIPYKATQMCVSGQIDNNAQLYYGDVITY